SNIIQGHVKSAFNTAVAIDRFIHCLYTFFDIQWIFFFQGLCEVLTDNKTGVKTFPIYAHVRAAFSKTSYTGIRFYNHNDTFGIILWPERNNKRLFEWNQ